MTRMNRGAVVSGTITDANATYARQWDTTGGTGSGLEALGNWTAATTDSNFADGTHGSGKSIVSFVGGTTTEEGKSVMIQPDGRILVAGVGGNNFAVARLSGGGSRYYVTQDANWNVTAVTDATGKVVDRYQYDPYGAITTLNPDFSTNPDPSGNVYIAYYYQGLRFDGNSGRYNARNRDYDPTVGAWVSADPAEYVNGASLYQAFGSSPVSLIDPAGTDAHSVANGILSAIGPFSGIGVYVSSAPDPTARALQLGATALNGVTDFAYTATNAVVDPIAANMSPVYGLVRGTSFDNYVQGHLSTGLGVNPPQWSAGMFDTTEPAVGRLLTKVGGQLAFFYLLDAIADAAASSPANADSGTSTPCPNAAAESAGASSTLTNFSGKVGQATDGVLGGFVKADGTVDFVPFTRNGLTGHTAAQAAGAIPADAAGGFSVGVNSEGQITGFNFNSALNGENPTLSPALQQQIRQALAPVTAK